MKLAFKIVLLCLVAMVVMSGLFSYLTIQQDAKRFADEHSKNASELAKAVRPRIAEAWANGGHEGLANAVRACSVEFRHVTMRYVRLDDSGAGMKPSVPERLLETIYEDKLLTVTTTDPNGVKNVHTIIPFDETDAKGGLEVSKPMQEVDDRARGTLRHSLFALLGTVLFCAAIVVVGGVRMIGRPLNLLVAKTKRIGEGDFTTPVNVLGSNELSQLGSALNEMCDKLAAQQSKIQAEANSRVLAEKQLRHADRLNTVGRLAAGVAHELGTPLNVVSGRAALIANGKLPEDEVRESAATIKSEADRITKIIRNLLDFARRDTPQRSRGSVKSIVEETVSLVRNFAHKRDVTIAISSSESSFDANVDAGQLQQVFANLLMNAVQAIDDGGNINIRLATENVTPPTGIEAVTDNYVRVDVEDSGTGISVDDEQHIFEPFFTTKDVGDGTGLGLSISYGIVRDHDGWIEVMSEPNKGSCFSVFLPSASDTNTN